MERELDSAPRADDETVAASPEELTSVMTALEPDQIISTKEHHHCPRRQLTRTEMVLFWGLRAYLLFMVGVVVYQIWTGLR
jgi:hypothetical protein